MHLIDDAIKRILMSRNKARSLINKELCQNWQGAYLFGNFGDCIGDLGESPFLTTLGDRTQGEISLDPLFLLILGVSSPTGIPVGLLLLLLIPFIRRVEPAFFVTPRSSSKIWRSSGSTMSTHSESLPVHEWMRIFLIIRCNIIKVLIASLFGSQPFHLVQMHASSKILP